ncbi:D-2-hydroxyacid dehydrogenase [Variovorax sp. J22R115]|uniref:D-2-hydroxyacid dehydrogenase n=1 Tax=Variovorax sp. J22R115 TaxID=3053509 RepID=UPI002578C733|nr:D-2-hydroxyacid dehydrogenase [Variovorax sp. J22R115]MDM0053580.1 D-2-hydroxyacid dehydrogenase [Variovorax sp. J22R115]
MQPLSLMLPADLAREFRAELDGLIGRPWRVVDPKDEDADLLSAEIGLFSRSTYANSNRAELAPAAQRVVEAVKRSRNLAWLHVFSSGIDNPIYHDAIKRGLRVSTSTGGSGATVALTGFTGLLALARGMPRWIAAKQDRAWSPVHGEAAPPSLEKQTAVVVGTGAIGVEFARLCQAVGLQCIGVRRGSEPVAPFKKCVPIEQLWNVLELADWLVLACPLTSATRRLIDARMLARLPRSAQLVNVARGGVVVEKDLVEALREQTIAGAYLDVFEVEPLPADSPLWDMPQVILSPHNAAASRDYDQKVMQVFLKNLELYLAGKQLLNEVALERIF